MFDNILLLVGHHTLPTRSDCISEEDMLVDHPPSIHNRDRHSGTEAVPGHMGVGHGMDRRLDYQRNLFPLGQVTLVADRRQNNEADTRSQGVCAGADSKQVEEDGPRNQVLDHSPSLAAALTFYRQVLLRCDHWA